MYHTPEKNIIYSLWAGNCPKPPLQNINKRLRINHKDSLYKFPLLLGAFFCEASVPGSVYLPPVVFQTERTLYARYKWNRKFYKFVRNHPNIVLDHKGPSRPSDMPTPVAAAQAAEVGFYPKRCLSSWFRVKQDLSFNLFAAHSAFNLNQSGELDMVVQQIGRQAGGDLWAHGASQQALSAAPTLIATHLTILIEQKKKDCLP